MEGRKLIFKGRVRTDVRLKRVEFDICVWLIEVDSLKKKGVHTEEETYIKGTKISIVWTTCIWIKINVSRIDCHEQRIWISADESLQLSEVQTGTMVNIGTTRTWTLPGSGKWWNMKYSYAVTFKKPGPMLCNSTPHFQKKHTKIPSAILMVILKRRN